MQMNQSYIYVAMISNTILLILPKVNVSNPVSIKDLSLEVIK